MKLAMVVSCATVLSAAFGAPAIAQQDCDSILRFGIWDSLETSSAVVERAQVANWYCSASSRSGGGGVIFGPIDLRRSEASSASACASNQSSYMLDESQKSLLRTASGRIVDAWSNCMRAYGEHASPSQSGHRSDSTFLSVAVDDSGGQQCQQMSGFFWSTGSATKSVVKP
jgi:hypothetical protein